MTAPPYRIFFDTEFIEDGHTIEPLSIGMVDEYGSRGLYIVIADVDRTLASPWVAENVIPNLDATPAGAEMGLLTRREAARRVRGWVASRTDNPEFWADYCSYDWVLLCQLFGTMLDLPNGWPMFCRDIEQERHRLAVISLPEGDDDHNAYQDALTTRDRWRALREIARLR